jgi:hypothetical protein
LTDALPRSRAEDQVRAHVDRVDRVNFAEIALDQDRADILLDQTEQFFVSAVRIRNPGFPNHK